MINSRVDLPQHSLWRIPQQLDLPGVKKGAVRTLKKIYDSGTKATEIHGPLGLRDGAVVILPERE